MKPLHSAAHTVLLITSLAVASCAPAARSKPVSEPAPVISELSRYLPLEHNTVFAYQTEIEETGERGIAVFEIKRPRPELAELSVAGQVRKRYYFEPAGVRSGQGGYLLKSPLALNAEWTGDDGKVRVTNVDQTIDVPAGKFSGCLQTVEEAKLSALTRKTTTVFCPGVGITLLEIQAEGVNDSVHQRLTLKSFGPRFTGM